jgi:hypothetical protein
MNKKGAELSMNVIIVSIIALVVLVVLIIVFVNKMGVTVTQTDTCENNGGNCKAKCTGTYETPKVGNNYKCTDKAAPVCCVGLSTA